MAKRLAYKKGMCKYRIVFTPKFRRKIIYYEVKKRHRRDNVRECNDRPCAMVVSILLKFKRSKFHGILERKDRHDDL